MLTKWIPESETYAIPSDWHDYLYNGGVGHFSIVDMGDGVLDLFSVYIQEGERGKGYGQKMLQELIATAKEMGVQTIYLYCFKDNSNARHIYHKLGWQDIPERNRMNMMLEIKE